MQKNPKASSRISIRNIDNIHEEILEEVEANTLTPTTTARDDSDVEKASLLRPSPLNYAQEYLYIKMVTTRSPSTGPPPGTSAASGGVITNPGRKQLTHLAPLREAKSARSLVACSDGEESIGRIRRPPSPLTLPRDDEGCSPLSEEQEKKKSKRSREKNKDEAARTLVTKGEANNHPSLFLPE